MMADRAPISQPEISRWQGARRLLTRPSTETGFILLAAAISAGIFFVPQLWWRGDDAEFITLARGIATGRWMRYINMPGEPRSVKFPFGFPLMLAGVERIVPGSLLAMKVFVAVLFALSMPIAYRLAKNVLSHPMALVAVFLTLTNPFLIEFSHHIMSEIPYLLFSLAALLVADRVGQGGDRSRAALTALLVAAATLIKPVGLTLGVGLILVLVLRGHRLAALAVGSGCLAAVLLTAATGGPFAPASAVRSAELDVSNPEFQPYVSRILERAPYEQDMESANVMDLARRAAHNLWGYATVNLPLVLMPFPAPLLERIWTSTPGQVAWILVTLCSLGVGLLISLRKHRPEAWYAIVYIAAHLLWPSRGMEFGPGRRYLVPLIPILLIFLLTGLQSLLRPVGRSSHRTQAFVTGIVVVMLLLSYVSTARDVARDQRHYPPSWVGYYQAAAWLKSHSPVDTVVLARKPFDLYLASGRRTAYYPYSPDPGDLIRATERYHATYVIVDNLGRQETSRYLVPAINANRDRFQTAFASSTDPRTYVFRVVERTEEAESAKQ